MSIRDAQPPLEELAERWEAAVKAAAGTPNARNDLLHLLDEGLAWAVVQATYEKNLASGVDMLLRIVQASEILDSIGLISSLRPESIRHLAGAGTLQCLMPHLLSLRDSNDIGEDRDLRLTQAFCSLICSLSDVDGQSALALSIGALPSCMRYTNCISSPKAQQARPVNSSFPSLTLCGGFLSPTAVTPLAPPPRPQAARRALLVLASHPSLGPDTPGAFDCVPELISLSREQAADLRKHPSERDAAALVSTLAALRNVASRAVQLALHAASRGSAFGALAECAESALATALPAVAEEAALATEAIASAVCAGRLSGAVGAAPAADAAGLNALVSQLCEMLEGGRAPPPPRLSEAAARAIVREPFSGSALSLRSALSRAGRPALTARSAARAEPVCRLASTSWTMHQSPPTSTRRAGRF